MKIKLLFFYILLCSPLYAQEHWMIVFIHGIMGIQPHLTLTNIPKFFRDKIAQSAYERTIQLIRQDPFFYQHQPIQQLGLKKIDPLNKTPGACATAYAHLYDEIYKKYNPQIINRYYTFGWSGLLSSRMRHYEAKILYNQLQDEVAYLRQDGINPKICLITYSHGGNIALKLAQVHAQDIHAPQKQLSIDQFVSIGLPVLCETDFLINSPLFKKIYHVFSYGDRVQPLDYFSKGSSNRMFKSRFDFQLPDKLVQIELRIRRPRSLYELNKQTNKIAYLNKRLHHRNANPGHSELWSFDRVRESFPLYPLPAAIFLPYIVHLANNCLPGSNQFRAEIHPYLELTKLTDLCNNQDHYVDFFSTAELNYLKSISLCYKPTSFSKELQDQKITAYKCQARREWLTKRNIRRIGGIKMPQS